MLKGIEACLVKMSATYFYDVAATNQARFRRSLQDHQGLDLGWSLLL